MDATGTTRADVMGLLEYQNNVLFEVPAGVRDAFEV